MLSYSWEADNNIPLDEWVNKSVEWLQKEFNPEGNVIRYVDENGAQYGRLERKIENGSVVYEWNENLNLEERAAVKLAIDVKQAKKPPQIVNLPVSLSVVGGDK